MKRLTLFLLSALCAFGAEFLLAEEPGAAWMGQTPPGESPVPFAPAAFAALGPWVETVDFSPDGSLCLASVGSATYANSKLYASRLVDGAWTPFAPAEFCADFRYSNEPVFLPDGKTLLFTGAPGSESKDLWKVGYGAGGWGKPVALPAPINSEFNEFRACLQDDGSLYFASGRTGILQVYRTVGDYAASPAVELVGPPISRESIEADPCVARDGRYLVFMSCKDKASANNYLSFRQADGSWGVPVKLGQGFNSGNDEYGAHLTPDGKYLFFTRHGSAGNKIYWVAATLLDKLRP